jgi:hypothetical protein
MPWRRHEKRFMRDQRKLVVFLSVVALLLISIVTLFAFLGPAKPETDQQWRDQMERDHQIAQDDAEKNDALLREKHKEKDKEHASRSP